MIAKENIEVGKAVKFSKLFNGDNVDSRNFIRIEDLPRNRKIINESSTIRVSVKNANKNEENELRQETDFNYPKENKMITIYIYLKTLSVRK